MTSSELFPIVTGAAFGRSIRARRSETNNVLGQIYSQLMLKTQIAQLRQLATATHETKLENRDAAEWLVKCGYAGKRGPWYIATPWGIEVLFNLKEIKP